MGFDLKTYLKHNREIINSHLKRIISSFDHDRELIMAMQHSLMAGGKRLRPILSMAAAQACEADALYTLPAGCALEMIHTYSLIHDDLPAMDDDDLRRGKPTCHKQFSEAVALLAGDALLTHAFCILSKNENIFEKYPEDSVRIQLIFEISKAAGTTGMVEGQMMDMESYPNSDSDLLSHLKKIHALKTGKMIIASVVSGGISVGADQNTINRLSVYADRIGLAFQVVDDILNVEGDPKVMGKAAGSDQLNDKMTFPAIIGVDASKTYAKQLIDEALDSIHDYSDNAEPLKAIASYIINRKR